MALFAYQQQCLRYLNDQGQAFHNVADLAVFINEARVQIALGSECLRMPAQLAMLPTQQAYHFSDAAFVAAPTIPAGLGGVGNIRTARLVLFTGGQKRIPLKAWEYFDSFYLAVAVPVPGPPVIAARLQPGIGGTIWFAPAPDNPYQVNLDTVAYPAPLTLDSDPEALSVPWQDAVPFFACHLALLSIGDHDGAMKMFDEYSVFERRAVQMTTPSRTPNKYSGGRGAQMAGTHMPLTAPQRSSS
jgi:hypothetical protein